MLCNRWGFCIQRCAVLPVWPVWPPHPLSLCFLPGRMYGADDFLPMLTYVVAQCDMPQLDMEIQYMMELLDPSLLQGEGRSCWLAAFQQSRTFLMYNTVEQNTQYTVSTASHHLAFTPLSVRECLCIKYRARVAVWNTSQVAYAPEQSQFSKDVYLHLKLYNVGYFLHEIRQITVWCEVNVRSSVLCNLVNGRSVQEEALNCVSTEGTPPVKWLKVVDII